MSNENELSDYQQLVLAKIAFERAPDSLAVIFNPIRQLYGPMSLEDGIIPVQAEDMRVLLNLVTIAITPMSAILDGRVSDMRDEPVTKGDK